MGYLTTITINNDGADNIKNHPVEFADKVVKACAGLYARMGVSSFGVGMHGNMVQVQTPRHGDDKTIFVQIDNGVYEINPFSPTTRDLQTAYPELFDTILGYIEAQLHELKGETAPVIEPPVADTPIVKVEMSSDTSSPVQVEVISDEKVVKRWLKENNIDMTVTELKKLKKKDK